EPLQEAVLDLFVDLELDHAARVVDGLVVDVDPRLPRFGDPAAVLPVEDHRQQPVLHRVAVEDVGEGGRDDRLEAEVLKRPYGVLARRPGAEVAPRDQDRVWLQLDLAVADPVVEEELAEASALDPLQKLLGDDLVGVDVAAVEHRDLALDQVYRVHLSSSP